GGEESGGRGRRGPARDCRPAARPAVAEVVAALPATAGPRPCPAPEGTLLSRASASRRAVARHSEVTCVSCVRGRLGWLPGMPGFAPEWSCRLAVCAGSAQRSETIADTYPPGSGGGKCPQ